MSFIITPGSQLHIMGAGHNVVKQFPMFGKGPPLRWWAEKGYVHWEDAREKGQRPDQYYGMLSWQDAARRVLNLSQMITNSSEQGHYSDEANRMKQFVSDMESVIREAKAHGGLHDKGASEEHKRRSKTSVAVSAPSFPTVVVGDGDANRLAHNQGKMEDPFNL